MSFKDISIRKIIRAVLLTEKNVKLYMEKLVGFFWDDLEFH